jgi:hypothetical protein
MSGQGKRMFGRRGQFRSLSFVVACLCLAVQALSVAHHAVVRHATCLEHGELVHAGASYGPVDDGAAASGTGARLDATPPAASDEHEHCLACAARKAGAAGRAVASLPPPSGKAASETAPLGVPCIFWSLFRLAPKTSPPV